MPAEAHRRFRADLRAQRERNLKTRAEQLAQHEEKKRFVAEWIAAHGTPEQRTRANAGVLPIEEAIEAVTDHTFAAVVNYRRYALDGMHRLQELLDERSPQHHIVLSADDVLVSSADAETMSAAQWAVVNQFRHALPDATVVLRVHRISWKKDASVAIAPCFGVLVSQRVGPFTLRREFDAAAVQE